MDFLRPGSELAPLALRALAQVARAAANGLGTPQRALLDALESRLLCTGLDVAAVAPIAPEALAEGLRDPAQARQLVRWMLVVALAEGPPGGAQMSFIESCARVLRVDEPAVAVIRQLARGRRARFRVAFLRRSHIRTYLRNTRRMLGGVRPMVRAALVARGLRKEDAVQVARYRALAGLPEGSLGRCFHEHYTKQGLAFPGERGGFPVGALFHDFSHVLAGYDTSPEGELKNAAFQAGFSRDEDDFFVLLFAIVIHTAGVNLAPFPMPRLPGRIAQGRLAHEVVHAWERGARLSVDLGEDWDFWEWVEVPLDVARRRLGVPPVEELPAPA